MTKKCPLTMANSLNDASNCIENECMAWVEASEYITKSYCRLIGT